MHILHGYGRRARIWALGAALGAAILPATGTADTLDALDSYFIQPILYDGNSVINGLEENGATARTESYYNAPTGAEARVDLADGSLKGYAETQGGVAPVFVQPRFGETLTFDGAVGQSIDFTLAVDGTIYSDARVANLNSILQVSVDAYIAVFDGDSDVDASNWYDYAFNTPANVDGPLILDRYTLDLTNHASDIDMAIDQVIGGSLTMEASRQTYKVFANLTLISNRTANPGRTALDFLNTASFGISADPGVSFSSASGVFLQGAGGPAQVPLPASGWLLLAGIGAMAARRKRQACRD